MRARGINLKTGKQGPFENVLKDLKKRRFFPSDPNSDLPGEGMFLALTSTLEP